MQNPDPRKYHPFRFAAPRPSARRVGRLYRRFDIASACAAFAGRTHAPLKNIAFHPTPSHNLRFPPTFQRFFARRQGGGRVPRFGHISVSRGPCPPPPWRANACHLASGSVAAALPRRISARMRACALFPTLRRHAPSQYPPAKKACIGCLVHIAQIACIGCLVPIAQIAGVAGVFFLRRLASLAGIIAPCATMFSRSESVRA